MDWNVRLAGAISIFTKVTTAVSVVAACFIMFFWGKDAEIGVEILWQILGVSALCTIASFILPWDDETSRISKKEMLIRMILCFCSINAIVLLCGAWFEWFDFGNWKMVVGMEVGIAAVFALITSVGYLVQGRETERMNQKLSSLYHGKDEE